MRMTLEELYGQYVLSIDKQKRLIAEYRRRLNEAQRHHRQREIADLNRHLTLLYEEKYELEGHAAGIKGYLN